MKIPSLKKIKNTARGAYLSMLSAWVMFAALLFMLAWVGVNDTMSSTGYAESSTTVKMIYSYMWLFSFSMVPLLLIAGALLDKLVIKELVKEVKEGDVVEVVV